MFAVVKDFDGSNEQRINLEKFTKHTSLWLALSDSVRKLQASKLDSRERIFIVFSERERRLLVSIGKQLGMAGALNPGRPEEGFRRAEVTLVLKLFTENLKLFLNRRDFIKPTYYTLSDTQHLPAYEIIRSNFVEEGGLPPRRE